MIETFTSASASAQSTESSKKSTAETVTELIALAMLSQLTATLQQQGFVLSEVNNNLYWTACADFA